MYLALPSPDKEEDVAEETSTFENVIATLSVDETKKEIKNKAENDWEDDFVMQNFVIDQQTDAFNELKEMELTSDVEVDQMNKAFKDWKYDFTMVLFAYEQQMDAFNDQ